MAELFRSIMKTNKWPDKWAVEHGLTLKKVKVPATESDVRIISLTSFWSKCMESFIIGWLDQEIGHLMDLTQYGGLKGSSVNHYLIDLVNFVLYNQDLSNPSATLAVLYDFEKAFNRQDHNTLITLLSDMGTPGWLLKLVIAFLEDRRIVLNYKGCTSKEERLPGGGPQGTKLGLYLFLILINGAGFNPNKICKNIGKHITKNRRSPLLRTQQKYVDDMTQCCSMKLKDRVLLNPNPTLPNQYHERTGHILDPENNPIQAEITKLTKYAQDHKMKINQAKTKVMLFNQSRTIDVLPALVINEDTHLETVEETKLLGVIVSNDMKWHSNTRQIISKCYSRMWMLRNLKKYGANEEQMCETYIQQIRSISEMACPVWNGAITQVEVSGLERVQRTALAIIRGVNHTNYKEALEYFKIDTLKARREALCLKFAIRAYNNPKFTKWFPQNESTMNTRGQTRKLQPIRSRTARFGKSPIPYLNELLNTHLMKKEISNNPEVNRTCQLTEQSL